jgi:hypothetical protein
MGPKTIAQCKIPRVQRVASPPWVSAPHSPRPSKWERQRTRPTEAETWSALLAEASPSGPRLWTLDPRLARILAVQVHVGPPMTIQYRDFFLKRLPDDLPIITPAEAKIPADAVKVVPQ